MNDELSYSITISKYYFRVSKRSASPHSLTRRDCFVTQSSTEGTHALDRVSRPLKAPRATHSIVSIRRAAPRRHPCWTTNAAHTQPTNARKARRSFSLWVGGGGHSRRLLDLRIALLSPTTPQLHFARPLLLSPIAISRTRSRSCYTLMIVLETCLTAWKRLMSFIFTPLHSFYSKPLGGMRGAPRFAQQEAVLSRIQL